MASSCCSITSSFFLLLCFLLSNSSISEAEQWPEYRANACYVPSNDRLYFQNVNTLLSALTSKSISDYEKGFAYDMEGQGPPDQVFGLYLCRADLRSASCQACISNAGQRILKACPGMKDSTICFNELLEGMLEALIPKAATGQLAGKKFAVNRTIFTASQTLYMLAQCRPDLKAADCNQCLQAAATVDKLPRGIGGAMSFLQSCNIRYGNYSFYNETAVALMESAPTPALRRPGVIVAIIAAAISVTVVSFLILRCFLRKRHGFKQYKNDIQTAEAIQFNFAAIRAATNNFSADNKLGDGGFGVVYKGRLQDGQDVAVKRLFRSSAQGAADFKNEVEVVAKLQHRNLVRLLGFCVEGEEKILVFEYMPNRSLDYFLFDSEKRGHLDWSRRYFIVSEIAQGMLYLHEYSRLRIIHRDLKIGNILLDENMHPKISDFGMARIVGVNQTQGTASKIAGTLGYMPPEYVRAGQFSVKSDVYSFGMLVLEIMSGKKNSSFGHPDNAEGLPSYAWKHWTDGTPMEVLDPILRDPCKRNEVIRCIHMSLLCVQQNPADRPTMSTIDNMHKNYTVTLPDPQPPAFGFYGPNIIENNGDERAPSANKLTITQLEPR
ncbi:putative receptor-like protein kinase At4g00960 isoform X2 [Punica granatum]|uniref:Receptor-like protein kinase At4g00960 isoform X2 n=1 Tax=Punica granatum TaxID=22663 RepID=A0A6P8DDU1_PUNGR|nr:putative receptor-like protein kinase At4g00960 isoform X2 [Punica granatum]